MSARHEYRRAAWIWIALMVLLASTWGSAYVKLGTWNAVINFTIATAKVLLVALFFMHLRTAAAVTRLVAVTALFMLGILFALSLADYATRGTYRAPWQLTASPPSHNLQTR
jgi:cytochrome c oxidase subunit 4